MTAQPMNYYFGCHGEAEHYLWNETGRQVYNDESLPDDFPFNYVACDGYLLPPKLPQEEGRASLIHFKGAAPYTVLTFWDGSVDSRPGCCSAFILHGLMEFDYACQTAKDAFPWVWERFTFEVRL